MTKRIAFLVHALSGDELLAGKKDIDRVKSVFENSNLGHCDDTFCLPDCSEKTSFFNELNKVLDGWDSDSQLILYYSGHGVKKNGHYCMKFGTSYSAHCAFDSIKRVFVMFAENNEGMTG